MRRLIEQLFNRTIQKHSAEVDRSILYSAYIYNAPVIQSVVIWRINRRSASMVEIPEKKWYELEKSRDIFLPFTMDIARNGVIRTLNAGGLTKKNFWTGRIRCTGTIIGNFLDISISIPGGKGTLNYHVYGEIVSHSEGCLIRAVIRDRNPFYAALMVAGLIVIVFVQAGTGIGIFSIFFFGCFAFAALAIQHVMGINAVEKAIRDSTDG